MKQTIDDINENNKKQSQGLRLGHGNENETFESYQDFFFEIIWSQ